MHYTFSRRLAVAWRYVSHPLGLSAWIPATAFVLLALIGAIAGNIQDGVFVILKNFLVYLAVTAFFVVAAFALAFCFSTRLCDAEERRLTEERRKVAPRVVNYLKFGPVHTIFLCEMTVPLGFRANVARTTVSWSPRVELDVSIDANGEAIRFSPRRSPLAVDLQYEVVEYDRDIIDFPLSGLPPLTKP